MGGEGGQARVGDEDTLVQVQPRQGQTALGQGLRQTLRCVHNNGRMFHLEPSICEVMEPCALQGDEVPAVAGEGDEGLVREGDTV